MKMNVFGDVHTRIHHHHFLFMANYCPQQSRCRLSLSSNLFIVLDATTKSWRLINNYKSHHAVLRLVAFTLDERC